MQTATNPDTGEKVVLIGSEWKPFTQSATNSQGVKAFLVNNQWMTGEGMPKQRQGVDQFGIPITIKPTEPEAPRSFGQRIMGNIETIPALAGSMVGGVVAPIAQLGHELTQGQAFTPQGKAAAAQFGQQVQGQFYQPRTQEAQRNVQAIGEAVIPLAGLHLGGPVNALAPATRAIGDVARSEGSLVSSAASNALAARAAKTQAANVAASYANAPMIEGTQAAHRLGAAVNPAISNPTLSNRARGAIAGPAIIEEKLATSNAVAVTNKVREDLGVPANKPLDASAIDTALDNADKPNDIVRKMAMLVPDANVIKSIEALQKPASAVAKGKVEASNALISNMLEEIKQGRSGADVLNDIRQLRAEANNVYKRRDKGINVPTAAEIAEANTRTGIAKAYEQLIDANVKDPNVLGDIKLARTRQAQIFDHERALDYGQQKVDPQAYAKMYEERQGKNMTGVGQDIALAASTHPSVFTLTPAVEGKLPRFSRAGLGGLIGGTVGSAAGPVGTAVGLAAGTGIGSVAGGLAARRMGTPAYQAARAMPTDYRPAQNMLRPVEPNYAPNQMVPYDYSQSVVMPGETPNFVFGRPESQVNVGTQYAPNQLPAPSAEGTLGAVAAERARAAGMSRTMGTQAEAQQAAAEAAARRPARGGTPLVFDTAGNLVEAPAAGAGGVIGAPSSLESAVQKLSGIVVPETQTTYKTQTISPKTGTKPYTRITKREGETTFERGVSQAFDLTSEERIAWNKSKADLAEAAPDLKGLSDKAIATKMMDRQWIADTISNLREKDRVFNEMAQKSALNRAATDAANQAALKREQMLQQLMELQDNLRPARPVQKGGQGPKTRAFQRNMLTPEQEILNALAK
jgi:hypothetical protein